MNLVTHRLASFVTATLAVVALSCAPALTGTARAQSTVDYTSLGNFTPSTPVTVGDVTATTNGVFNVSSGWGLGVFGNVDEAIDQGESILFTFASPATNVSVGAPVNLGFGSGPVVLEAFSSGGASLGQFDFYSTSGTDFRTNTDLSSRVGNVPISSFRVTSTSTGVSSGGSSVQFINYTTSSAVAAPEPGSLGLAVFPGALFLGGMIRRRVGARA